MKGILHHVELYVRDLNISNKFWIWLLLELGYREYQKWEKGIKILYEDRHPYAGGSNYYAVYFEDPDRMKVEITSD